MIGITTAIVSMNAVDSHCAALAFDGEVDHQPRDRVDHDGLVEDHDEGRTHQPPQDGVVGRGVVRLVFRGVLRRLHGSCPIKSREREPVAPVRVSANELDRRAPTESSVPPTRMREPFTHPVRASPEDSQRKGEHMAERAGTGTEDDPWQLTTAPGSSPYTMYRDEAADPPLLVCQVGSTRLTYLLRAARRLAGLAARAGRLGAAGCRRREEAGAGRARSRLGSRARTTRWVGGTASARATADASGCIVPPLLEALGLAELTHDARNNRSARLTGSPCRFRVQGSP